MSSERAITHTRNTNEVEIRRPERELSAWTYRPDVDIVEEADHYVIVMDVPGVRPEDVELLAERDSLTVRARVSRERSSNGRAWLLHEYGVGDYFRRFVLDETADREGITAECSGGVLRITVPKHEAARLKRIPVQASPGANRD